MIRLIQSLFLCILLATPAQRAAAGNPDVLVSIRPLHSLTAYIMQGIGEPGLLIQGLASPHGYALKPSDAQQLANAKLVIWVGPELEGFLKRPLDRRDDPHSVLTLLDQPGLTIHNMAGDEHGHHDHDHNHAPLSRDPHLWLDVQNAIRISELIAERLGQIDPLHARHYRLNTGELKRRLLTLEDDMQWQLTDLHPLQMMAFHNAWQYLQRRYDLNIIDHVVPTPDQQPGTRHLTELAETLQTKKIACVLTEPQFRPRYLQTLLQDTQIPVVSLDPLGSTLPTGPDQYEQLMRELAKNIQQCLPR